ncbi:hypothetical protein SSPO_005150 [Streptomyces antimycoticus]|uniref:Uncharacterized protein n=1 Tax=Streptomyces antimycoticus TaxID=68175 RepID=A0A499UV87_9ACTN|nr:hypothetical protein [Streptomyces antimycoticus]BBJ37797.1 hypothetical protein SSPO_005150 [Streptomyces antimycoticus]
MAITDETIKRLRAAAAAGGPDAARELGRLLCMLRSDSLEHLRNPDFLLTWPEEQWLRAALRTRPDDRLAAVLLAGRLVQQINYWKIDDDNANAHGEDERTLVRRRDEAHALYTQTLQAAPDDPAARAGIATLNAWADDADIPFRTTSSLSTWDQARSAIPRVSLPLIRTRCAGPAPGSWLRWRRR